MKVVMAVRRAHHLLRNVGHDGCDIAGGLELVLGEMTMVERTPSVLRRCELSTATRLRPVTSAHPPTSSSTATEPARLLCFASGRLSTSYTSPTAATSLSLATCIGFICSQLRRPSLDRYSSAAALGRSSIRISELTTQRPPGHDSAQLLHRQRITLQNGR